MITGPGLVAYKQPFSTNFSKDVVERPLMVSGDPESIEASCRKRVKLQIHIEFFFISSSQHLTIWPRMYEIFKKIIFLEKNWQKKSADSQGRLEPLKISEKVSQTFL